MKKFDKEQSLWVQGVVNQMALLAPTDVEFPAFTISHDVECQTRVWVSEEFGGDTIIASLRCKDLEDADAFYTHEEFKALVAGMVRICRFLDK